MSTAAQQLSQWIETVHPDFFSYLYGHVARRQAAGQLRSARLRGFGDDGDDFDFNSSSSFDVDSGLDFTPDYSIDTSGGGSPLTDIGDTNAISSQYTPMTVDIQTLTSSDLNAPLASTNITAPDSGTLDVATDNSGGFLTSLGSGISSAASSVGNFLTSAQGLGDVTKLATAYFQPQNTQANAAVQTQLIQAQAARAAAGQSPMPVTYALNSAGQLVPIYAVGSSGYLPASLAAAVASGASQYVTAPNGVSGYTVPSNLVSSLGGATSLSSVLPWLALIVGGLILAKGLSK